MLTSIYEMNSWGAGACLLFEIEGKQYGEYLVVEGVQDVPEPFLEEVDRRLDIRPSQYKISPTMDEPKILVGGFDDETTLGGGAGPRRLIQAGGHRSAFPKTVT